MKKDLTTLFLLIATCLTLQAETNATSVAEKIIGDWVAGETMMPQPPKEMWQDIKSISFQTNGNVRWSEVKKDKLVEQVGRYEFIPNNLITKTTSKRGLPSLTVSSTNSPRPCLSGICMLYLSEIEIDYDCRFHTEIIGKVLKAETKDGKRLVFVKMKEGQPKDTHVLQMQSKIAGAACRITITNPSGSAHTISLVTPDGTVIVEGSVPILNKEPPVWKMINFDVSGQNVVVTIDGKKSNVSVGTGTAELVVNVGSSSQTVTQHAERLSWR